MTAAWWKQGVRFECQGSGRCCVSHGESGYVYLTRADVRRLGKALGLTVAQVEARWCRRTEGRLALLDAEGTADCIFLKDRRCSAYEGRPTQCRTWPWWPEIMGARAWSKAVRDFCPGAGKGRLWTAEEILAVLDEQTESDLRG